MTGVKRTQLFQILLVFFVIYAASITLLWLFGQLEGASNAAEVAIVLGAYVPLVASLAFWLLVHDWHRHEDDSTGKLRKTLEDEQLRGESVLTALDEGVLIMNKNGIVKYMNPRISEMMAATDHYMVGKHFSKLASEHVNLVSSSSRNPRLSVNIAQVFETGKPVVIEHERLHYPDTNTSMDLTISLLPLRNGQGEVSALMIVGRDIGGLIRVQEKEERFLVRAGERLTGSLQPALAQLSEISQMTDLTEQAHAKIADAQVSLTHLKQLVDDVQMYTSLTLKDHKKELKFTDTTNVFNKAAERAVAQHADKYVTIQQEVAIKSLVADEKLLQLVVDQLVDNAYKFSPDKDTILVRAVADGSTAVIEVADNGAGIADEQRSTIFEPFAKDFDPTYQDSTGLGMSICKKIIDDWGGEIKISAQESGGVVMTCTIPDALRDEDGVSDETIVPAHLETIVEPETRQ